MNRKGVTIVELLIYIVLFAIVFFLIGKQFKGLVDNYSRGHRTTRQMTDARDILGLMVREIRNTGVKRYYSAGSMEIDTAVYKDMNCAYSSTQDSSSFDFSSGDPGDELTIYKLNLDNSGDKDNFDKIRYYLSTSEPHTLKRELWHSRSTGATSTNSIVARNVYALQFAFGILGDNTNRVPSSCLDYPSTSWDFPNYGSAVTYSYPDGGPIGLTFNSAITGSIKYNTSFSVSSNEKYTAKLNITKSNNLDYLAITFREGSNELGTEQFLPYSKEIEVEIPIETGHSDAYACLDFKATGQGAISISHFEIARTKLSDYTWKHNFDISSPSDVREKGKVRAIRIYLLTRSEKKAGTATSGPITVGDVNVTRSGEYTWRLYTETVSIPNNGF